MDYKPTWNLATIPDETLYAELGRRRSAARTTHASGSTPTCTCGTCRKCKKREAIRRYRAKLKEKKQT